MDNTKMTMPRIGSKWRHYKTGEIYEVAAVRRNRDIQPVTSTKLSDKPFLAFNLEGSLWPLLSDRYDTTMVFYLGESGRWCRSLHDFCGTADSGEKRFVEVE